MDDRFDQLRRQLRLAPATGADPPHTIKALGVELRPPTAHRVRSRVAPSRDLVVGDALASEQEPLRLHHHSVRQRRGPGHRFECHPLGFSQLQYRCAYMVNMLAP